MLETPKSFKYLLSCVSTRRASNILKDWAFSRKQNCITSARVGSSETTRSAPYFFFNKLTCKGEDIVQP